MRLVATDSAVQFTNGLVNGVLEESKRMGENVTEIITLEVQRIPEDVKQHSTPEWLESWSDLEYGVLNGKLDGIPLYGDSTNASIKAAAYAYAHATGDWGSELDKRQDGDKLALILSFWNSTVDEQGEIDVEKRAWACFSRVTRCIKDNRHAISAVTLSAMLDLITGGCNYWYDNGASSLCMRDPHGDRGCWSWSGGWHSMLGCVLKAGLDSVANDFGTTSSYSCYCEKAIQEGDYKRGWYKDQLCVSNRPDGCGSTSHQESHNKRFNWDISGYAYCST